MKTERGLITQTSHSFFIYCLAFGSPYGEISAGIYGKGNTLRCSFSGGVGNFDVCDANWCIGNCPNSDGIRHIQEVIDITPFITSVF
jgi:hypothetical protein